MTETPARRAALLVIHGMGEQHPYQSLDAFASGLARALAVGPGTLRHVLRHDADGVATAIRIPIEESQPLGVTALDVHEFYWAGMTHGRIGFVRVFMWIVSATLLPLLAWSRHPGLLLDEARQRAARTGQPMRGWLDLFLREIARAALLAGVALVIVSLFAYVVFEWPALLAAGTTGVAAVAAAPHPLLFGWWVLFVALAALLMVGGLRLLRTRVAESIERPVARRWAVASVIAAFVFAAAAVGLDTLGAVRAWDTVGALFAVLGEPTIVALAVASVLFVTIRRLLITYVGDIVLYVTADERSSFFRTRHEILSAATARLRTLLGAESGYDAVYVAGHSLGSVIAYDAINRLIRGVRAEPADGDRHTELGRLRGLLTFGSPLDKVYYFFRTEVGAHEAIRAQILSSLHAFRRKPSGRSYGDLTLARYGLPEMQAFVWCNVWNPADLISGELDFYTVDEPQPALRGGTIVTAHLEYWRSPAFYEIVRRWMGLGRVPG